MSAPRKPPKPWRVYASAPPFFTCRSERAARRLARKLSRRGSHVDLYEGDGSGDWNLRGRVEAQEAVR